MKNLTKILLRFYPKSYLVGPEIDGLFLLIKELEKKQYLKKKMRKKIIKLMKQEKMKKSKVC